MVEALLYPQTTLYPVGLFKFFSYLTKLYILDLGTPKKVYETILPELKDKIQYVILQNNYKTVLNSVYLYTQQLKSFGEYLRHPENLKYYQLHRDLFEEHFQLGKPKGEDLSPIERAFAVLILAEEIDISFLEVSLGIKKFFMDWKKFFDEKILFSEGTSDFVEELLDYTDFESLQNINHRRSAFSTVFHLFEWKNFSTLNTLLITEKTIVDDILDNITPEDKIFLDEFFVLLKFSKSLNSALGFPSEEVYPQFNQILTF